MMMVVISIMAIALKMMIIILILNSNQNSYRIDLTGLFAITGIHVEWKLNLPLIFSHK